MRPLLLTLMLCVANFCMAQSPEYYNVNRNFLREDSFRKAVVVRTDETGHIVWAKELSELSEFQDDGQYIVAAEITVKNGKVLGNPSDYDYWIVLEDNLAENVKFYPTLCDDYTIAFVGFDPDHQYMCRIFNLMLQEIGTYFLIPGENIISTSKFTPGQYLILSYQNEELIETSKIIVTR